MAVEAPAQIPCPNGEDLRKLLRGKLADERQSELTAHLDDCPNCRSKLELLADGDTNLSGFVKHIDQTKAPSDSAMWNALNDVEASLTATFALPDQLKNDRNLDFLQPLRLPGKIGRL